MVLLAGTLTIGLIRRNQLQNLHTCIVSTVGSNTRETYVNADCGNGTKVYQQTTQLDVLRPVCYTGTVLVNCNTLQLNVMTIMLACGITLTCFITLFIVFNLVALCGDYTISRRQNTVLPEILPVHNLPPIERYTPPSVRNIRQGSTPESLVIPMHHVVVDEGSKMSVALGIRENDNVRLIVKNPT